MKKLFLFLALFILTANLSFAAPNIDVTYDNGIYHIILKGEKTAKHLKFESSTNLITTAEAHKKLNSYLTVNAGFFDPKTGKSISYIVNDRQTVEDPLFTDSILQNPFLRQHLNQILNRTEFRVIECNIDRATYRYEIMPHNAAVDFGCSIITSAQGGPLVYPDLKLEDELFVVKDKDGNVIRESASVLHKTSRTIIGLKDGD